MQAHTVRVKFTREKQPKDYEKSAPEIEFSAGIDEGEDPAEVGKQLMLDAATVVYAGLGMDVPASVAEKLGGDAPEEAPKAPAKKAPAKKAPAKKAAAKGKADEADVPDETAPASAKGKADVADVPEETAPASAKGKPAATEDVPDETEAPTDADGDVPDEDAGEEVPEEDGALTAEDLQKFVTAQVSGKKIGVKTVKEIMASYKASRTSDIPADKREEFKAKIELESKD